MFISVYRGEAAPLLATASTGAHSRARLYITTLISFEEYRFYFIKCRYAR